jgi:cyclophilin family peptidyl-prolyl cis-trans isomerase
MRRLLVSLLPLALLLATPSASRAGTGCTDPADLPVAPRPTYAIDTALGRVLIRLFDQPGEAPLTVANFVNRAELGDYDGSFFHRFVPGFVFQGGGFTGDPVSGFVALPSRTAVQSEAEICNVRGTLAMALVGSDANSGRSQFFFNVVDNPTLDTGTPRFTVFAEVLPESLPLLDELTMLHRESGLWLIDDPIAPLLDNLPVLEILDRNPAGWDCIASISPDPTYQLQVMAWWPTFVQTCADFAEFDAALALAIADFEPQFPERLVTIETVPEPGAALQLAVGAAALAGGGLWRRRRRG